MVVKAENGGIDVCRNLDIGGGSRGWRRSWC